MEHLARLADIEAMLTEMKPWYNNYCFAKEYIDEERLYNCDMVLYYLRHQVAFNRSPEEMVDMNVRTDYKKLQMLADIDRGNLKEKRMSVIEEISRNLCNRFDCDDVENLFPCRECD